MLRIGRETTLVTTLRGDARQRDGRLGHEVKNIVSGALLAHLFNWSYTPPASSGARGFREVDEVLELAKVARDFPRLRMRGEHLVTWTKPGACPAAWPTVTLNETGFAGIESFAAFTSHLAARVPSASVFDRLCVVATQNFRLHLHHVHAWETQGYVQRGVYAAVTASLRRAMRWSTPAAVAQDVPASSGKSLLFGRRGTIGLHVRRGDRVGRRSASTYTVTVVRHFAAVAAHALVGTGLFPLGVDVTIYTEPANSSEVFAHGCPSALGSAQSRAQRLVRCRVTTGAVLHDLEGLARSDVLGLSSSSFSVLAYYLRQPHQPALVPVKTLAQFFAAADGSDGRNASRRARVPPPANLIHVHALLQLAEGGRQHHQGLDGGDDDERPAESAGPAMKALTRRLRAALLAGNG